MRVSSLIDNKKRERMQVSIKLTTAGNGCGGGHTRLNTLQRWSTK